MGLRTVQDIVNKIYNAVTGALGVELKAGLPAGTNKIGNVAIDQTTPGTTNKVVAEVTGSLVEEEPGSAIPTRAVMIGGEDALGNLQVPLIDALKNLMVSMGTSLNKDLDSIDVAKMSKGGVTTAHNSITETATSEEINCSGYNSILVEAAISVAASNWTFKVQGCTVSGGTFVDCYELANTGTMTLMSYQTNASKIFVFKGIPDYVKIVATEDVDGATVTVRVQPLNL